MKRVILIISTALLISSIALGFTEKSIQGEIITSFEIGMGKEQIPNFEYEGGAYYSPKSFFVDENNNYIIYIHEPNEVKRFSPEGNLIDSYDLSKVSNKIVSIYYNSERELVYALTNESLIYILDNNYEVKGQINISNAKKYLKPHLLDNIKVLGEQIYVYTGQKLLKVMSNGDEANIEKVDGFLNLDKDVEKIFVNTRKIDDTQYYVIKYKSKEEFALQLPSRDGLVYFIKQKNENIYFYIGKTGLYDAHEITPIIGIINKSHQSSFVTLRGEKLVGGFGFEILVDIDKKGNIYNLCKEGNKIVVYRYTI